MTLAPLLTASAEIQLHVAAALLAITLGPVALYTRPGRLAHRAIGYLWVGAMTVPALSSFAIHGFAVIGPFSPLHGLAVLTLWSLWEAIRHAPAGRIAAHRRVMRNLYWFGVMVAGLFNFLPGRAINRALPSEAPDLGYVVIALGLGLSALLMLRGTVMTDSRA